MAYLPPPKSVSGLIKLARYSALFLGLSFGTWRERKLKIRADRVREIMEQQDEIRHAKKKIYKDYLNREEMLYLGEQANMPRDPDFDEQYPPPDTAQLRHLCDLEEDYVSEFMSEEGIRLPLTEPCEKIEEIESKYGRKKRSFGGWPGVSSQSPSESASEPCETEIVPTCSSCSTCSSD